MYELIVLQLIGWLQGGWMIFEGLYAWRKGRYFASNKPELWRSLAQKIGIEPLRVAGLFVLLGLLWLLVSSALLFHVVYAWWAAFLVAVASLWYLPMGTLLALIQIFILIVTKTRLGY